MDNTETHTTWNTRHRAKINKTVYTKQKIMNNTGACECNIQMHAFLQCRLTVIPYNVEMSEDRKILS
jgi:hypothetical protein